ncbi:protein of unknown function [Streptomyces murinus]
MFEQVQKLFKVSEYSSRKALDRSPPENSSRHLGDRDNVRLLRPCHKAVTSALPHLFDLLGNPSKIAGQVGFHRNVEHWVT